MSRFPNTRMALARIFANLAIIALPIEEMDCHNVGFAWIDLLKARHYAIKQAGCEQ